MTDADLKKTRKDGLDKFYTVPERAKICIDKIKDLYQDKKWDLIIEPSAGNGSFLTNIKLNSKKIIGIDIAPEKTGIIKQDFLLYNPSNNTGDILVIGNPPFGKNSSLAVKFFNHAASWCKVIAFIVPRTFRKISIQNRIDLNFHLKYDEDVPLIPCQFSPKMNAKCCYQIWEYSNKKRPVIKQDTSHKDWIFLGFGEKDKKGQPTPPKNADFAIRAYGGKIGEIKTENLSSLRPKSWHWIKANIDIETLLDRFKRMDFSNSLNTSRQNSIGRGEFVSLYNHLTNCKF